MDVFSDAQGTQPVVTEQERTFDVPDLPQVLYVEGTDHSDEVRDIDLTLEYLHDGEALYTDVIKTTVVRVDLDIANGGSDLDLGGSAGPQPTTVLPESDEEIPGAYLLVNWDNDDGASPPQPDLGKNSVTDEDNLARLVLHLEPALEEGALTLAVDSDPVGTVKLWFASTKECEVTDPGWDLSQDTPPTELWVEGRTATTLGQKVELQLTFVPAGSTATFGDTVKATVVMINLGNAVYREGDILLVGPLGHGAIVWRYEGTCTPADLNDDTNFRLIEMGKVGTSKFPIDTQTLDTITSNPSLPRFGCYTNTAEITHAKRLRVLRTAEAIVAGAGHIGYTADQALRPAAWPDTVATIMNLRCDGLVEVSYEFGDAPQDVNVNVWGAGPTGTGHHNICIDAYQAEHDHLGPHWRMYLVPATQCGHEHTHRGTEWETEFEKQNLCDPVGSTGGN